MTPENIDRNEIIEQELKAYLDGAYAKYSDAKSQLEAFAKLVMAKAAEREREACAKIVEESSLPDAYSEPCLLEIANEIRERGQQ